MRSLACCCGGRHGKKPSVDKSIQVYMLVSKGSQPAGESECIQAGSPCCENVPLLQDSSQTDEFGIDNNNDNRQSQLVVFRVGKETQEKGVQAVPAFPFKPRRLVNITTETQTDFDMSDVSSQTDTCEHAVLDSECQAGTSLFDLIEFETNTEAPEVRNFTCQMPNVLEGKKNDKVVVIPAKKKPSAIVRKPSTPVVKPAPSTTSVAKGTAAKAPAPGSAGTQRKSQPVKKQSPKSAPNVKHS